MYVDEYTFNLLMTSVDLMSPVHRPPQTPIENKGLPSPGYHGGQIEVVPNSPPPEYVESESGMPSVKMEGIPQRDRNFTYWTNNDE